AASFLSLAPDRFRCRGDEGRFLGPEFGPAVLWSGRSAPRNEPAVPWNGQPLRGTGGACRRGEYALRGAGGPLRRGEPFSSERLARCAERESRESGSLTTEVPNEVHPGGPMGRAPRFSSDRALAQEAEEESAAQRGEERLQVPFGELGWRRGIEEDRGRGEELVERLLGGVAHRFHAPLQRGQELVGAMDARELLGGELGRVAARQLAVGAGDLVDAGRGRNAQNGMRSFHGRLPPGGQKKFSPIWGEPARRRRGFGLGFGSARGGGSGFGEPPPRAFLKDWTVCSARSRASRPPASRGEARSSRIFASRRCRWRPRAAVTSPNTTPSQICHRSSRRSMSALAMECRAVAKPRGVDRGPIDAWSST